MCGSRLQRKWIWTELRASFACSRPLSAFNGMGRVSLSIWPSKVAFDGMGRVSLSIQPINIPTNPKPARLSETLENSKWRCSPVKPSLPVSLRPTPPKLFENPSTGYTPASNSRRPLLLFCRLVGGMGADYPNFADVSGASALLFLADSSPAPPPPPPALRYVPPLPLVVPPNCVTARTPSLQFNRPSVVLRISALQRRALLSLGLLLLLRSVGELVRFRLGKARPPRRSPPRASRCRLPPPHQP